MQRHLLAFYKVAKQRDNAPLKPSSVAELNQKLSEETKSNLPYPPRSPEVVTPVLIYLFI